MKLFNVFSDIMSGTKDMFNGKLQRRPVEHGDDTDYALFDKDGNKVSKRYMQIKEFGRGKNYAIATRERDEKEVLLNSDGKECTGWFEEIEELKMPFVRGLDKDMYVIVNVNTGMQTEGFEDVEEIRMPFVRVMDKNDKLAIINLDTCTRTDWFEDIDEMELPFVRVSNDDEYAIVNVNTGEQSEWFDEVEEYDEDYFLVKNDDDEYAILNKKMQIVSKWGEDADELTIDESLDRECNDKARTISLKQITTIQGNVSSNVAPQEPSVAQVSNNQEFDKIPDMPVTQECQDSTSATSVSSTETDDKPVREACLFSDELKQLINYALVDGNVTDKKRNVLIKRAVSEGWDSDEFEIILDSIIYKGKQI